MGKKNKKQNVQKMQKEEWPIRCACGQTAEIEGKDEVWIKCDICEMWQHNVCMGLSVFDDEVPTTYGCEQCSPELHQDLLKAKAEGMELWEERQRLFELKRLDVKENLTHFPLTESCHHYTKVGQVDWDIQKYVIIFYHRYNTNTL